MCHVVSMEHENEINISNQTNVAVCAQAFRCIHPLIVSRPSRWFPPFPDNPLLQINNQHSLTDLNPPGGELVNQLQPGGGGRDGITPMWSSRSVRLLLCFRSSQLLVVRERETVERSRARFDGCQHSFSASFRARPAVIRRIGTGTASEHRGHRPRPPDSAETREAVVRNFVASVQVFAFLNVVFVDCRR